MTHEKYNELQKKMDKLADEYTDDEEVLAGLHDD